MTALIVLLAILIVFGIGFAIKALWFLAAVLLLAWAIGFVMRSGEARWYRW